MATISPIRGKQFHYKVFDNGDFVANWCKEVVNQPSFSIELNGWHSELKISLARNPENFGENYDVKIGNEIFLYVSKGDEKSGEKLVYHGIIYGYTPFFSKGDERVEVSVMPYAIKLSNEIIKDSSGNTTIDFFSVSPKVMITTLLGYQGDFDFDDNSIKETNTKSSYTFNFISYKEALEKIIQLSPFYWAYYIDENDRFYFFKKDINSIDHFLYLGKEITDIKLEKNSNNIINRVYFVGGGTPPLYYKYENTGSILKYGIREIKLTDGRVTTNSTASYMANKKLNESNFLQYSIKIKVCDKDLFGLTGYHIEDIKIGDIIQIPLTNSETETYYWDIDNWDEAYWDNIITNIETKKPLWDEAEWDIDDWDYNENYIINQPLQVKKIKYNFDNIEIEVGNVMKDVSHRIEDLKRNQDEIYAKDLASSPS
jgi:hypothetical protein